MIKNVTIYGERCSGTNYLENLISMNFDTTITSEFGWKHFFGFTDLCNSHHTLFIGIIRDPYEWINSLYREKHHISYFHNIDTFLNNEFYSTFDNKSEIMSDRNIYTKERYKNIFEMRHTKLKFLIEDMPLLVKNYIFIRYEDLINDFDNTMNKIKEMGLNIKNNIEFPLNTQQYKKKDTIYEKDSKINYITKEDIRPKINMFYENILGYTL